MSEIFNFTLDAGTDEDIVITYSPNNVAFPLDDWKGYVQLRRKAGEAVALELSTEQVTPGIEIDAEEVTLKFRSADIAALTGVYEYALLMVDDRVPPTLRICVVTGKITFKSIPTQVS